MPVKLICMSFDGEYQTGRPDFEDVQTAWKYCNDLGSKWYFYPFNFVVSASGKTIVDAPDPLAFSNGRRTATLARQFAELAARPEAQNMNVEEYLFYVLDNLI